MGDWLPLINGSQSPINVNVRLICGGKTGPKTLEYCVERGKHDFCLWQWESYLHRLTFRFVICTTSHHQQGHAGSETLLQLNPCVFGMWYFFNDFFQWSLETISVSFQEISILVKNCIFSLARHVLTMPQCLKWHYCNCCVWFKEHKHESRFTVGTNNIRKNLCSCTMHKVKGWLHYDLWHCLRPCLILTVSAATDRPAQHGASRPPCCTQMSTVSVMNWWPTTITSLPHWPST